MPIKPPPAASLIDWSEVVFDLLRSGLSARQIGMECGYEDPTSAKAWVQRLKNIPGTQPKFHHGAMLLGLWSERVKQPPAKAPRERYPGSRQQTRTTLLVEIETESSTPER